MAFTDPCSGGYFDETTISIPSITQDDDSVSASQLNRHSTQSPGTVQASIDADATAKNASVVPHTPAHVPNESDTVAVTQSSTPALPETTSDVPISAAYSQRAAEQPDGPGVVPDKVAPPEPEEEASFSSTTQQLLDLESPQRPAKVVYLPSEDAKDERLHEVEEEERSRKSSTDQAKTSRPATTHLQTQAELASSPSSTVGAYSAATPMPPQDSPDTSPDSESAEQVEVLPPKDMRPSAEEQREKEQHDRLLEAQKELANKAALGDVSTADEQLRWEEREAAAREAEERAAHESVDGPEPDARNSEEQTQAEEVIEGVECNKEAEQLESEQRQVSEPSTQQSTVTGNAKPQDAQDDGDNITVAPRNKAPLTIDTTSLQQPTIEANGPHTRIFADGEPMITRTLSGALPKRTVSEILSDTLSQPGHPPAGLHSPEAISPMTLRHPRDTPVAGPSTATLRTPRRPPPPPEQPHTPYNSQSALEDLTALKGAAEDPDRDYLEPLFRIQAHDSPNVRTTALPDLVRSASKNLSTEDHFTTLHERLDYRILRRIYQLQNAVKWPLRQMEAQKQPDQPITHHDHMMTEMKWMRKDFKAERKMKKSVCTWLADRCAAWVAASATERKRMQVRFTQPKQKRNQPQESEDQLPDLEQSGESAPEDDVAPLTPRSVAALPNVLVVPPELSDTVSGLQKSGKLSKAVQSLPVTGWPKAPPRAPLIALSKFIEGRVLPNSHAPSRKRSRYDYEDDAVLLDQESRGKRLREERELLPEDQDSALFHPENKPIRERLHANNAFRPPSEFVMPATQFYEFRNGSQWIWEDDQKLRKLAKEYSFNWSLIADELNLPGSFKSSAERRTPWECFERWVELDQLPTEMRKTMYFKTWFQRLEQSSQAAERRYQAQVAAIQAQSNTQTTHVPMRRRTVPTRVDKRKNTRYLWLVDAMRKLARKKEQHAYKQAEGKYSDAYLLADKTQLEADKKTAAHRAAAQRKNAADNNQQRPVQPMRTPQEFSKMRYEADLKAAEQQRQNRQKYFEAQRQMMVQRAQQQQQAMQQNGGTGGAGPNQQQQRPGSSSNVPQGAAQQAQMQQANGQQAQPNMNSQVPQQTRQALPMATRNGHLAVPQISAQGIPQAQMRAPNGHMPNPQEMQRIAHANAQARSQYGGQGQGQPQQYQQQMPSNASMASPGGSGMNAQQQLQSSQAMLAAAMQQGSHVPHQNTAPQQQMSVSPSMPPPPTPQQTHPQALSSGHVPALLNIKNQLQAKFPTCNDQQINQMATEMLKSQSANTNQARQSAMNAAAGINGGVAPQSNMQVYAHNQATYQSNQQIQNGASPAAYMNGDGSGQQTNMSPASPQQQQVYAAAMMRRMQQQQQQMRMQQSPNGGHATLNGSPSLAHASPQLGSVSPSMQYANMNHNPQMTQMNMAGGMNSQRPPSRSATPQMQRLGSSGSVPGMAGGMPSPQGVNGLQQGSPRNMQASMAR